MMAKHFLQRELRILEKEKEINELQSVSKVICLFFVLKDCIYLLISTLAYSDSQELSMMMMSNFFIILCQVLDKHDVNAWTESDVVK